LIGQEVVEVVPVYGMEPRRGPVVAVTESDAGKGVIIDLGPVAVPLGWKKDDDFLYKKYHSELGDNYYCWAKMDNVKFTKLDISNLFK